MDVKNVSNFYKSFSQEGVIISYQGPFMQEMIEEISTIINNKLSFYTDLPINGKYLNLFIELSQNILRYSADSVVNNDGRQVSNGLILLGIQNGSFYIISGNPINDDQEDLLKEKLNKLKTSSKDELKKMFKEQLKLKSQNLNKSAGLGLIEISRKADNLEHEFTTLENGNRFFSLKIEFNLQTSIKE